MQDVTAAVNESEKRQLMMQAIRDMDRMCDTWEESGVRRAASLLAVTAHVKCRICITHRATYRNRTSPLGQSKSGSPHSGLAEHLRRMPFPSPPSSFDAPTGTRTRLPRVECERFGYSQMYPRLYHGTTARPTYLTRSSDVVAHLNFHYWIDAF